MVPLALEKPVHNQELVECPCCHIQMFAYKLAGHMAKVHKHRNPVKPYVLGSICIFCLKDYQSRAKLVNHLCYHSLKCRQAYMQREPLPPDVFLEEEAATARHAKTLRRAGRSQLFAPNPVVRICGPLIPMYARTRRKCGPYNKRSSIDSAV